MKKREDWKPYDPTWLVELAREQQPKEPWLPEALAKCTRCRRESEVYLHFVDPSRANKHGSEWQFETNLELQCPTEGWIVLDILSSHRIGGVEFVDKIKV